MNKQKNETKSKIDTEITRILSIGSSFDLSLTLTLTESQCENLNIHYSEINSLSEMKDILMPNNEINQAIASFISLSSPNLLINSLLYINRANKVKSFIEYIIPFKPKYPNDALFMKNIVKYVTQHNLLFIDERGLMNISPSIKFFFKLLSNNSLIKDTKSFIVTTECEWDNDSISNNYNRNLFNSLNIDYKHSIFYSSITDLFKCKIDTYDEVLEFLHCLKEKKPEVLISLIYSSIFDDTNNISIELFKIIKETLALTDIFIFESEDAANYFYFHSKTSNSSLLKPAVKDNKDDDKINIENYFIRELDIDNKKEKEANMRKMKIGVFINELKSITIIHQNPITELVFFHSRYECSFYPGNPDQNELDDYNKLLIDNYSFIKSIFVGGLLSRLFNKKSFQTCVTAGNESVKRVIDLIKYDIDFPTTQSYYEILVKRPKTLSFNQLDIKKKEDQFVLDCTNVLSCQKKNYNPLYDNMCASYFHSPHHRHHLMKLGFINKKGLILQAPETKEYINTRDKSLFCNYEKEAMRIFNKKEKNEIMNRQMKSIANSLYSLNQTSSVSALSFLTYNKNNSEMQSLKKLPSINPIETYYHQKKSTIKDYNGIKVSSPMSLGITKVENDTNKSFIKKKYKVDNAFTENKKSEKKRMIKIKKFTLDKTNFISMLNYIEKKIKKKTNTEDKQFNSDDDK